MAILIFTVFFARDSAIELSGFLSSFLEKPDAWPLDTEFDVVNLLRAVFLEVGKALAAMLLLLMVAGIGASVFQHAPSVVARSHRAKAVAHLDPRGLEAAVRRAGLCRVR